MQSLLLQLVVAANSLALVLPPGWCGSFVRHDRKVPAPVRATCCHQPVQDCPPRSERPPAHPGVRCCCERDATAPEKPVQPAEDPPSLPPLVAGTSADPAGQFHGETARVVLPP